MKLTSTQRAVLERMAEGGMLIYMIRHKHWVLSPGLGIKTRKPTAERLVNAGLVGYLDDDDPSSSAVLCYVISDAGRVALAMADS